MEIIDGKKISEEIYTKIKTALKQAEIKPKLAVIIASDDEASKMYVRMKMKKCEETGILTELSTFKENSTSQDILQKIAKLNEDSTVNGILVQLPLYPNLEEHKYRILNSISPLKDPDGLSAINYGLISQSMMNGIIPATVDAILECIKFTGVELQSKNVLIINNSDLVGKPLASIIASLNATVTIANKFSEDLKDLTKNADLIVAATGQTKLIKAEDIKKGAILIDVTSLKTDEGVIGDFVVDDELREKASFLTPVPGGVGPLTIACLLRNLVNLAILQRK